jgi:hypothetical protein
MFYVRSLALGLSLACADTAFAGPPAQDWTMYDRYTQSYTLPFASGFGTGFPLADPTIKVSLFGTTITPPIDTGSRGMIVSQNLLPGAVPAGPKASIFYWSSGRKFTGIWTTTTLTFPDAVAAGRGTPAVATATVPVLIVQRIFCEAAPAGKPWPNACADPGMSWPTTKKNNLQVMNFGVGLDRTGYGSVPDDNAHNQQFNPFLNLDQMRIGVMRAGWVISLNGVQLGLTAANTGPGYAYTKLQPTGLKQVPGSPPDWQPAFGQVALNGQIYPAGQGVIDLGIGNMLLTLPPPFPTTGTLAGPTVTNYLLGLPGLVGYSFVAGSATASPAADQVTWTPLQKGRWSSSKTTTTLLNTGRDPVAAFNYLYDATGGYLGLQMNGSAADAGAFLTPALGASGTMMLPSAFETTLPVWLGAGAVLQPADTAKFHAAITGPGNLVLVGGTVTMDCVAGYTGSITVNGGTLTLAPPVYAKIHTLNGGAVTTLSRSNGNC